MLVQTIRRQTIKKSEQDVAYQLLIRLFQRNKTSQRTAHYRQVFFKLFDLSFPLRALSNFARTYACVRVSMWGPSFPSNSSPGFSMTPINLPG